MRHSCFILKILAGSRAFILPGFTSHALHLSELSRLVETAGCQREHSDTRRPLYRLPALSLGHSNSDGRFYLPFSVLDAWIFSEVTKWSVWMWATRSVLLLCLSPASLVVKSSLWMRYLSVFSCLFSEDFILVFCSGLPNFPLAFVVFFEVFRLWNKDFRIDQLRKTSDLTSAPGGITILSGYSPLQASSLGWEHDWCLPLLVFSSLYRLVLFVCLSDSGMKIHECVQGHVYKLRMHHDGSRLCVISYYYIPTTWIQ